MERTPAILIKRTNVYARRPPPEPSSREVTPRQESRPRRRGGLGSALPCPALRRWAARRARHEETADSDCVSASRKRAGAPSFPFPGKIPAPPAARGLALWAGAVPASAAAAFSSAGGGRQQRGLPRIPGPASAGASRVNAPGIGFCQRRGPYWISSPRRSHAPF